MNKPIQRETAYRLFLMEKLRQMCQQGRAYFTIKDLAEFTGLKPTPNMRRQLRSFVADGSLEISFGAYREYGNIQIFKFVIDPAMEGK